MPVTNTQPNDDGRMQVLPTLSFEVATDLGAVVGDPYESSPIPGYAAGLGILGGIAVVMDEETGSTLRFEALSEVKPFFSFGDEATSPGPDGVRPRDFFYSQLAGGRTSWDVALDRKGLTRLGPFIGLGLNLHGKTPGLTGQLGATLSFGALQFSTVGTTYINGHIGPVSAVTFAVGFDWARYARNGVEGFEGF